jgi:hypothetical protein
VLVAIWLSLHAPGVIEAPGPWLSPVASGTAGCIDTAGLQARADALLGPDVAPPPTRVDLHVQRGPDEAWMVRLRIDAAGEVAERSLSGRDCTTLDHAIALVIAVHVDPLSVATRLPAHDEPSAEVDPPVIVEPPSLEPPIAETPAAEARPAVREPTPRRPTRREPLAPGVSLGAAVMAELGVLPRAAAAFELGVGLRWPRALVELGAIASVGPSATASDAPGVEGTFRLVAAVLRGCGVLGRARVEAAICGGLEAGDLWARSDGVDFPNTVHSPWLAATLGVRPRVLVHPRVSVGASVDLLVPLRRPVFVVDEELEVYEVGPIAARFGVSLELRLRSPRGASGARVREP